MADFGKLLRSLREAANVSMGALSRHLKVSVTYISDVERGTRAPLSNERIEATARLLNLSPEEERRLTAAAAESRGFYELGTANLPEPGREAGATLMRGWPHYTENEFERLKKFLEELEREAIDDESKVSR